MKQNNISINPIQFSRFFSWILLVICCLGMQFREAYPQHPSFAEQTTKLFFHIDLNNPSLLEVGQKRSDPEHAARLLLNYFQKRSNIHPLQEVERKSGESVRTPSRDDLLMANNALKHVFVGQSAYPPFFCGDNIDWGTRPVPDNEWVWQLNRMYFWEAMSQVYKLTLDERYAKEWCKQLVDWTQKNPNDKQHKYAWRSIEAGIRGYRWPALYEVFLKSPHFTPEVLVAFLNSCFDHADYLMTKYSSKSNWGLMEAEGLAFIALTFPEFADSKKWLAEAIRRLNNEIDLQVYPDGVQRELAMGYHLGCIDWFLRTYDMAKLNGRTDLFPSSYIGKVMKMCEVPLKLCHPDGTNPQFGDAWAGRTGQHTRKFKEWADRYDRNDFLFMASNGQQGTPPDSTAFALPQSGLYSMRSSWAKEAVCLVLKCGPDGGGHCQPDNGTFELSAGGRTLMPDGGSYIYSGDPENRAWFRQTKVHQTLTLNGENSKYAPRLLLWKPGSDDDLLVVENKSYQDLTHRRAVFFFGKRYFILVDDAIGEAAGDIDLHFQLAPGGSLFDGTKRTVTSDFSGGWNIKIQALGPEQVEMAKEEGQVSFLYTKKEPRPAFRYRIKKSAGVSSVRFVTLVAPYQKDIPEVKIRLESNPVTGTNKLVVEENGKIKEINYKL